MERHIRIAKPGYTLEFLLIVADVLSPKSRDDVPQRYINVARGETDGVVVHVTIKGSSDIMPGSEPEFLKEFALYCLSRMFIWLDVASRWEPELRTFVIHKEDLASVNNGEI